MKHYPWLTPTLILGSALWLLIGLLAGLGLLQLVLMEYIFLLAPLLIVPLGLGLIDAPAGVKLQTYLYWLVKTLQPVGAVSAVGSFLWPRGLVAGTLAAIWLVITLLVALLGLARFLARRPFHLGETGLDAGLAYLGIGGGWFLLARLGLNPLGFDHTIVFLTAVHFHYAGFATPLLAWVAGRLLDERFKAQQQWHKASVVGIVAGTPLVAAGITFSPLLEVIGAILVASSLAVLAYLMKVVVLSLVSYRPAQLLLSISGLSVILGLGLIYLYATGEFMGYTFITIPQMVQLHGVANALGFALCGLLGWNLLRQVNV
jgi:hypothetical protein